MLCATKRGGETTTLPRESLMKHRGNFCSKIVEISKNLKFMTLHFRRIFPDSTALGYLGKFMLPYHMTFVVKYFGYFDMLSRRGEFGELFEARRCLVDEGRSQDKHCISRSTKHLALHLRIARIFPTGRALFLFCRISFTKKELSFVQHIYVFASMR